MDKDNLCINVLEKIGIYVRNDNITQIPADAIITTYNDFGIWFERTHVAIQDAAGNSYHEQIAKNIVIYDLEAVVANGDRTKHKGLFDDVVFVVDLLESPIDKILYSGLKASHKKSYKSVIVSPFRAGVEDGMCETQEQKIKMIGYGLKRFLDDYAKETSIKDITFTVYNNYKFQENLTSELAKLR